LGTVGETATQSKKPCRSMTYKACAFLVGGASFELATPAV
jgi:hypothetical protein